MTCPSAHTLTPAPGCPRNARLNILGYQVGTRLHELLPLRDQLYSSSSTSLRAPPPPTRVLRLLPLLSYLHSPLYKYLFARAADSLEKSTEFDDEYMLGDNEMVLTKGVEVPKEMSELSCGALVAGIIEAVMDGAGFVRLPSSLASRFRVEFHLSFLPSSLPTPFLLRTFSTQLTHYAVLPMNHTASKSDGPFRSHVDLSSTNGHPHQAGSFRLGQRSSHVIAVIK